MLIIQIQYFILDPKSAQKDGQYLKSLPIKLKISLLKLLKYILYLHTILLSVT